MLTGQLCCQIRVACSGVRSVRMAAVVHWPNKEKADLEEDRQAGDAMQPWDEIPCQAGVYMIFEV